MYVLILPNAKKAYLIDGTARPLQITGNVGNLPPDVLKIEAVQNENWAQGHVDKLIADADNRSAILDKEAG